MILTSLWFLLILHKFLPDAAEKLAVAGVCGLCSVVFLLRVRERDNKHFSVAFQGKSFTRHLPTSQSISQKNSAMPPLSQVMLPRARVCARACVWMCVFWSRLIHTYQGCRSEGVNKWSLGCDLGGNTNTRHTAAVACLKVWVHVCLCKKREGARELDPLVGPLPLPLTAWKNPQLKSPLMMLNT